VQTKLPQKHTKHEAEERMGRKKNVKREKEMSVCVSEGEKKRARDGESRRGQQ